ncbi:MAG: ABC transporter permease [Firmicutes bacterium]|jgi:putative ABC transport system permease protein|nr:ABC transporter permease [Bacillota bacterium]
MKSYMGLVNKYLSAHKKKTRLTVIGVAISVALITGIFSMLDVFLRFEKIQVIHDYGNYHLFIKDASTREIQAINGRLDVEEVGRWIPLGKGKLNGNECELGALDENIMDNFNIRVIAGRYPKAQNEIILEQWVVESQYPNLKVNDAVKISLPGNAEKEFIVSGICSDLGKTKAAAVPGVFLSIEGAAEVKPEAEVFCIVLFKRGVKILNAEKEIKNTLKIADDRIQLNERLLAVIGQSGNNHVIELYATGAVLFLLVLIAGVLMIYNTFNISVMERVRQFGLLRCIGASQAQIKNLVKREGLYIALKALPYGVLAGMFITFICSAILKFYNDSLFKDVQLFTISTIGIGAGVAIGFLTVFLASFLPAKKAARVSPVNAVTGSNDIKIKKRYKWGILTHLQHVDIALGINNAVMRKKTFILMTCSIAISIIMFFGFQVFIDFMHTCMKTTKPYTPDISLSSEQGIGKDIYERLLDIKGVKRVYGRMFAYVDATFDATRLTDTYKKSMKDITVNDDGLFIPPEKSWLISYDRNQLNWSKSDLIEGTLDEDEINAQNGIIAVVMHLRNNISTETVNWQLGEKVYIDTPTGRKELKVVAILRTVPFSSRELALTTFITTEKLFTELTGQSTFKAINIQLNRKDQEQTVQAIKKVAGERITFHDERQMHKEIDQAFFTIAVFVYGFVAVIALISILNIINTMNTSVALKTRYFGIMRAIGMTGDQLDKMVLAEAAAYTLTGCITGCILGISLQRVLITYRLSSFHIVWKLPFVQIILVLIITVLIAVLSVISPLKRIKAVGISEVINSL